MIQIMQASESALGLFCANKKVAQLDSKFNFFHFSQCIHCVDLSGFSSPKVSHLVLTNWQLKCMEWSKPTNHLKMSLWFIDSSLMVELCTFLWLIVLTIFLLIPVYITQAHFETKFDTKWNCFNWLRKRGLLLDVWKFQTNV